VPLLLCRVRGCIAVLVYSRGAGVGWQHGRGWKHTRA
jgi:hypothetical protein